jgi:hypothetical protein
MDSAQIGESAVRMRRGGPQPVPSWQRCVDCGKPVDTRFAERLPGGQMRCYSCHAEAQGEGDDARSADTG